MWLSRNISQVLLKKIPYHVLIPCWHYGGTDHKFWSQAIWEANSSSHEQMNPDLAKACVLAKTYAKEHIGVDMDMLCTEGAHGEQPKLEVGDLGFVAAYIDGADAALSTKSGSQVFNFEVWRHRGEFRFDKEFGEIDEFVVVVTSDTITKTPDTQSIFIGLQTKDGVSRRVGLGWMYYSKDADSAHPPWKYKFFRIR